MVHSINVTRISGVSRMYWRRCLSRRTRPLMRFPRETEFCERYGHVCFCFTLKQPNLFCVFLSYLFYYRKTELPNWISSVWYWSTEVYATRDYTQCEDCVLQHFTLYRTCKSLVQLYELDNIETPPLVLNLKVTIDPSRPQLVVLHHCIAHHDVISCPFVYLTLLSNLDI